MRSLRHFGFGVAVALGLACLACLVLLLDRGGVILGTLRGESFYRGYSTSAWKREFDRYWMLRRTLGHSFPLDYPSVLTDRNADTMPVLIDLLKDDDDQICFESCNALGILGPKAKQAFPALRDLMQHPKVYHRRNAANALAGIISPETKGAISVLIAGLADEDPCVNHSSALGLGKLGPDASEAIPILTELLKSPRAQQESYPALGAAPWTVGDAVARALEQIDPEAAEKAGTKAFSKRWRKE